MKKPAKKQTRRLTLNRNTVRHLSEIKLANVIGGTEDPDSTRPACEVSKVCSDIIEGA